jgi:hypothetical protein
MGAHRVPPSANENATKKKCPNRAPWYTPKRITPEIQRQIHKRDTKQQQQPAKASSNSKQQQQAAKASSHSKSQQQASTKQQAASSKQQHIKQQAASSKQQAASSNTSSRNTPTPVNLNFLMLTREAGLIAMADMAHSGELSDDPISEVDSAAASQKDDSGDPDSDPSELLVLSSSSDLGRQLEAFCVESTQPNVDDYFSQEERPARDADSAPSSQHSFSIAEDLEYLLRGGKFGLGCTRIA